MVFLALVLTNYIGKISYQRNKFRYIQPKLEATNHYQDAQPGKRASVSMLVFISMS